MFSIEYTVAATQLCIMNIPSHAMMSWVHGFGFGSWSQVGSRVGSRLGLDHGSPTIIIRQFHSSRDRLVSGKHGDVVQYSAPCILCKDTLRTDKEATSII